MQGTGPWRMAACRKMGSLPKEKGESDKPKKGAPYTIMEAREERVQGEHNQKRQHYKRE